MHVMWYPTHGACSRHVLSHCSIERVAVTFIYKCIKYAIYTGKLEMYSTQESSAATASDSSVLSLSSTTNSHPHNHGVPLSTSHNTLRVPCNKMYARRRPSSQCNNAVESVDRSESCQHMTATEWLVSDSTSTIPRRTEQHETRTNSHTGHSAPSRERMASKTMKQLTSNISPTSLLGSKNECVTAFGRPLHVAENPTSTTPVWPETKRMSSAIPGAQMSDIMHGATRTSIKLPRSQGTATNIERKSSACSQDMDENYSRCYDICSGDAQRANTAHIRASASSLHNSAHVSCLTDSSEDISNTYTRAFCDQFLGTPECSDDTSHVAPGDVYSKAPTVETADLGQGAMRAFAELRVLTMNTNYHENNGLCGSNFGLVR
jgi:hypothetical protein